jgi:hypothetical protein
MGNKKSCQGDSSVKGVEAGRWPDMLFEGSV